MTLSSSLHCGPFSVSQSSLVMGSKTRPNEFRIPYEKTGVPYGFPRGTPPLLIRRNTLPPKLVLS